MKIAIPEEKIYNYILLIYEDLGSPKAKFFRIGVFLYAEKQQILYVLGHLFCKRCPMIPKKIRLRRANIINNPSPISILMKATVASPVIKTTRQSQQNKAILTHGTVSVRCVTVANRRIMYKPSYI